MKRLCTALLIAAIAITGTMVYQSADAAAKPKKGLIVGDVIELSTYAMQGHGEEQVAATRSRVEQGFPVAILEDETNEIYVAVYKNPAPASGLQTGNAQLADLVGKKVVAQGMIYKADGVNVIRMSLVSEY